MLKRLGFLVALAPLLIFAVRLDEAAPADPKSNYETYCSGCHGVQMDAFVDRQWKSMGNPKRTCTRVSRWATPGY